MAHKHSAAVVPIIALAVASCADSTGPVAVDAEWSGIVGQGDAIEIKGINGEIFARKASGNSASVTSSKQAENSDPSEVDIVVITHSGGVTICALYPNVPGQTPNECAPGNAGHMDASHNDVEVTFWASVPAGVDFVASTVNGSIVAADLDSDSFAHAVNGDISISTTQISTGSTVNGSISASIGQPEWDRDLTYSTVNGDVSVQVPAGTNADVRMSTVNGSVSADMPFTLMSPGNIRGVLGNGGRTLHINSVNGSVRLDSGS